MKWFKDCSTVEEIKKVYRTLAMKFHPDRGGDTETMQQLNAAYHTALKNCDKQAATGADGEQHTYYYNAKVEQEIMDKLFELLRVKMDATIMLIGRWIWIEFDGKPAVEVREAIKKIGCVWHSKRMMWYWRPAEARTHYSNKDLGSLAAAYGYKEYKSRSDEQAVAAA